MPYITAIRQAVNRIVFSRHPHHHHARDDWWGAAWGHTRTLGTSQGSVALGVSRLSPWESVPWTRLGASGPCATLRASHRPRAPGVRPSLTCARNSWPSMGKRSGAPWTVPMAQARFMQQGKSAQHRAVMRKLALNVWRQAPSGTGGSAAQQRPNKLLLCYRFELSVQ